MNAALYRAPVQWRKIALSARQVVNVSQAISQNTIGPVIGGNNSNLFPGTNKMLKATHRVVGLYVQVSELPWDVQLILLMMNSEGQTRQIVVKNENAIFPPEHAWTFVQISEMGKTALKKETE